MALLQRIVKVAFGSLFMAVVTFVGAPVAFGLTILAGLILLPLPATIPVSKAQQPAQATVIYDRYGHPIATLQQFDQNIPITAAEVPSVLKEAVIADEDRNFYHHGGVDLRGTLRAFLADVRNQKVVQGGSTITQQYVKLAYTGGQRNILRKIREAILASQLNRQASKSEILYRYLTLVYFGDGNYGAGAAAEEYFHTPVDQLDASQAATLSGIIPEPSARAPRDHVAQAEQYRQLVLGKMRAQGYLTQAGYDQAVSRHLALVANGAAAVPGTTPVYEPPTPVTQYPDFVDDVERWLLLHYSQPEVFGGGLRVQTTLDPAVQNAALASVAAGLNGTAPPLDMALASVEPSTGYIEALVAGRGFTTARGDVVNIAISGCDTPVSDAAPRATCWDQATVQGGSPGRQPGSSWKPFTLATAFMQGIPPTQTYSAPGVLQIPGCKPLSGQPASACQVHNDESAAYGGTLTLSAATAASVNTVYAQVAPHVGCTNVAQTAKVMGIQSAYYSTSKFPFCATYALGELDVSPLDMASAYGVFDDHGRRRAPTPILEVLDGAGKVLVNNIAAEPAAAQVIPLNVADNVTRVLQGVLGPGGTAPTAGLGRPAAGKTGTTSNYTNAWFVGYTPTLSTAVWMGNATSQAQTIGRVRDTFYPRGVSPVYGGTIPAATWKMFMTAALKGVPATPFDQPAPIMPPAAVLGGPGGAAARPKVSAGALRRTTPTPLGGPYQVPARAPVAPNPAVVTPTTVPATGSTTTTVPGSGTGTPPASTGPGTP